MKITLLDINSRMCEEWKSEFKNCNDIKIVNGNIYDYATKLKEQDVDFAIVSPANSFGMMDGGYDLGITNFYKSINVDIIELVQKSIFDCYLGEQPVATVLGIIMRYELGLNDIPDILHIPTMRVPMSIRFTNIPYMCMKELLLWAGYGAKDEDEIEAYDEIVIPAFGGGCGNIDFNIIAKQMKLAYDRCKNRQVIDLSDWNKISSEVRHSTY